MEKEELLNRLDLIEFRQELLFSNTPYDRLLFEYNLSRDQSTSIMDLMDDLRTQIESGEKVHHGTLEQAIYRIAPNHNANYHFAEAIAQELHRAGRWEEVFATVYGHMPKYQSYMNESR
ncbi:DUF1878 domain-containing protein [Paenibacillus harenae]|uniref:DUF1878 family protein n=1 Tax=Paenibacillus harenae TaxID=306543 RepID=A0ABT9U406_PAEHA|nr:DUF1878 domain-containing protein [Paenibacillus harenae]MDQ0114376.1 hypothetical protein [Paenibacillus harenae]